MLVSLIIYIFQTHIFVRYISHLHYKYYSIINFIYIIFYKYLYRQSNNAKKISHVNA